MALSLSLSVSHSSTRARAPLHSLSCSLVLAPTHSLSLFGTTLFISRAPGRTGVNSTTQHCIHNRHLTYPSAAENCKSSKLENCRTTPLAIGLTGWRLGGGWAAAGGFGGGGEEVETIVDGLGDDVGKEK
jgi:hypothetical protein